MKRLIGTICAAAVLLCMTACGDGSSGSGTSGKENSAVHSSGSASEPDGSTISASDYDKAVVWAAASPVSAGDHTATIAIYLGNNPTFEMIGLRIIYDEALSPVVGDLERGFVYQDGSVTAGSLSVTSLNTEERLGCYAAMSTTPMAADGTLCTFEVTLPQGAKSGDSYTIECEMVDFLMGETQLDVTCLTTSFTLN